MYCEPVLWVSKDQDGKATFQDSSWEIQSPVFRHHQSSSARGAPSLPAIMAACQHPPQSVMTLVKGTHLVPTLQSAEASKAAGVPGPWVGRPIWHREQDSFSGEDEEAANVSHSQAHFC